MLCGRPPGRWWQRRVERGDARWRRRGDGGGVRVWDNPTRAASLPPSSSAPPSSSNLPPMVPWLWSPNVSTTSATSDLFVGQANSRSLSPSTSAPCRHLSNIPPPAGLLLGRWTVMAAEGEGVVGSATVTGGSRANSFGTPTPPQTFGNSIKNKHTTAAVAPILGTDMDLWC